MFRIILITMFLLGVCAVAADRSGKYEGTYTSSDGDSSGRLRIEIQKNSDSTWLCKVFFTAGGDEISTKPTSCSVDNDKIVTEFDAQLDGSPLHAKLTGTAVDDKAFEGSYISQGTSGDDHGTWKVSLHNPS